MTRERAIGYLAATRLSAAQFSGVFADEFCDVLEWAIHLLQKTENDTIDERYTTTWANIPEASDKTTEKEIEDLKKEIEVLKEVDEFLHRRIKKLEKELYG